MATSARFGQVLAFSRSSAPRHGSTESSSASSGSSLSDKCDTVDLLQRGLAAPHGIERGLAQEARAVRRRAVLQLADRRARRDQLAQLVVEDQQLGDRTAPAVARAAAFAAALAFLEIEGSRIADAGLLQQFCVWNERLCAVGAHQA